MHIDLKMGSCCLIMRGIALILVVPLCSSFLLSDTDLTCMVCDEVHELADCKFGEHRCRPNQGCFLEVRGDMFYQRIKAGCGSIPSHCHTHHDKRSDHDFCDYPVLCNGDCRDSDSCNEGICDLPLYGHYEPTTTVKTTPGMTSLKTTPTAPKTTPAATVLLPSTKEETTSSGTTAEVSTKQTLPMSSSFGSSSNSFVSTTTSMPTATATTATPSPKQPISTSGATETVTASPAFGSSTNADFSPKTTSTPTAAVTSATLPSSKQPINTSGATETLTTSSAGSSGVRCATCSGPMCGYSPIQPEVQCPGDAPYCMNTVANHLDASKTITKACATVQDCKSKWWHQTSDRSECTSLNAAVPVNDEFTCHFCCVKDNCNKPVVPAMDSLFRG